MRGPQTVVSRPCDEGRDTAIRRYDPHGHTPGLQADLLLRAIHAGAMMPGWSAEQLRGRLSDDILAR